MRMCVDCKLPIPERDVAIVNRDGERANQAVHKSGCPDPVQPQPNHRGKKYNGVQAQLRVADLLRQVRGLERSVKQHVEHGELGTAECRKDVIELKGLARELVREVDAALERRKELHRGQ